MQCPEELVHKHQCMDQLFPLKHNISIAEVSLEIAQYLVRMDDAMLGDMVSKVGAWGMVMWTTRCKVHKE